jgi:Cache 3/Cache 2 fusion domain
VKRFIGWKGASAGGLFRAPAVSGDDVGIGRELEQRAFLRDLFVAAGLLRADAGPHSGRAEQDNDGAPEDMAPFGLRGPKAPRQGNRQNHEIVIRFWLRSALAMAAQDRGAPWRRAAHPVGTSIRKSALAESWSSGRCRQTGDLIGGVSADTFLGRNLMSQKQSVVGILVAAALVVAGLFASSSGAAQDAKVKTAMELLRSMAGKLGPPKIEGMETVGGKQTPAIYFGSTKMNNNFSLVDEVVKQAGGTATVFVKNGDQFVRVATNVKKDDGSRAVGTILDPKGKAIASIQKSEAFYGEVDILGKPYITGYEPIRDPAKGVIGIYYVGYLK